MKNTPRVVSEFHGLKSLIEKQLSVIFRKSCFQLRSLEVASEGSYIVLGLSYISSRSNSESILCISFSPSKFKFMSGVNSLGGTKMDCNLYYNPKKSTSKELFDRTVYIVKNMVSGFRRERIALHYFEKLSKDFPDIVRGVRMSNEEEDNNGIDLLVTVACEEGDVIVPIQVKSSSYLQLKHVSDKKRGNIPSMVVLDKMLYGKLSKSLISLLRVYAMEGKTMHVSGNGESLLG